MQTGFLAFATSGRRQQRKKLVITLAVKDADGDAEAVPWMLGLYDSPLAGELPITPSARPVILNPRDGKGLQSASSADDSRCPRLERGNSEAVRPLSAMASHKAEGAKRDGLNTAWKLEVHLGDAPALVGPGFCRCR